MAKGYKMKLAEKILHIVEDNLKRGVIYGNGLTKDQAEDVGELLDDETTRLMTKFKIEADIWTEAKKADKDYGVLLKIVNKMDSNPKNMSNFSNFKKGVIAELNKLIKDKHKG